MDGAVTAATVAPSGSCPDFLESTEGTGVDAGSSGCVVGGSGAGDAGSGSAAVGGGDELTVLPVSSEDSLSPDEVGGVSGVPGSSVVSGLSGLSGLSGDEVSDRVLPLVAEGESRSSCLEDGPAEVDDSDVLTEVSCESVPVGSAQAVPGPEVKIATPTMAAMAPLRPDHPIGTSSSSRPKFEERSARRYRR
ncbi:hypothetical protein [Mycolicibacterium arenosum]|uniref:Uncharacterized protein n=1 Tax=Mycolicibacterium arenosum TaxID=2952157 RepID=A0ABT1LYJ1_9MYCO|nr:hypothetical protein [Mycolicibacterium sp. CAU 1645]MCP9271961.1 hypothetical protein [Mycolicibacterium sp. CAU 1645]